MCYDMDKVSSKCVLNRLGVVRLFSTFSRQCPSFKLSPKWDSIKRNVSVLPGTNFRRNDDAFPSVRGETHKVSRAPPYNSDVRPLPLLHPLPQQTPRLLPLTCPLVSALIQPLRGGGIHRVRLLTWCPGEVLRRTVAVVQGGAGRRKLVVRVTASSILYTTTPTPTLIASRTLTPMQIGG